MHNILIGSLSLILASIFFVINDAIINFLSPQNIQFYHFIFYGSPAFLSVPVYLIFIGQFKNKLKSTNYYIPLIRGLIFLPLPFFTFISLKNITLPEYTTLNMTAPIFASLSAIFFLKEKFNIYILFSLLSGFFGVLLIMQPGFQSFNIYFIVVLFGAFLITITTTIVNKYNKVTSTIGYFIYGGLLTHIISIFLFILDPLKVNLHIFFLITISSITINLAIFLTTFALKNAQKNFASIFCLVYLQIIWSSLVGFIIFNEFLNLYAYLGAFFIIISGIFSIPGQYKQMKVNE